MNKQYLKPKAGLKVRNPKGGYLPEEGANVPMSPFWTRRLKDGDVVKATAPKTEKVQGDDVAQIEPPKSEDVQTSGDAKPKPKSKKKES